MKQFKGVFPALLTPYDKNGAILASSVKKLIDWNLEKGVQGFYVGGSTGEGLLLTKEERKTLFTYAAEANADRSTLIAHVGTLHTRDAIELAKHAEESGFDAISAVAPFYYGFSREAIETYYREIAESVKLPMIVYNFPAASGFTMTKAIAEKMFENPRFLGIKHTNADLFQLQQFKTLSRDIVVYNGFDEMFIAGLSMGADGGIGSTYNFMAEKFVSIYRDFQLGNIADARKTQEEANRIIAELIRYGVFVSEKAILEEMGIEMGEVRKPFLPISEEGKRAMRAIAKSLS